MANVHRSFTFSVLVGLALFSNPVLATDDPYLKMLEGEAEEVESLKKGQNTSKERQTQKKWNWGSTIKSDGLPTGLQMSEFEIVLQDNFYGTYVFYKKLSQPQRQRVFETYASSNVTDLETVRTDILNRMKQ